MRRRYDLEKAIAAHGGPAAVAQALGWSAWGGRKRNRKPRGYWDSPDNLRAAIDEFIAEHELEPGGWGGLHGASPAQGCAGMLWPYHGSKGNPFGVGVRLWRLVLRSGCVHKIVQAVWWVASPYYIRSPFPRTTTLQV